MVKEEFMNNVFDNKYIFKEIPVMLKYFLDKGINEFDNNEHYFKGNSGHPNLEACDIWTDILKDYIEKTLGKIN
jgi:hypothetical protein